MPYMCATARAAELIEIMKKKKAVGQDFTVEKTEYFECWRKDATMMEQCHQKTKERHKLEEERLMDQWRIM